MADDLEGQTKGSVNPRPPMTTCVSSEGSDGEGREEGLEWAAGGPSSLERCWDETGRESDRVHGPRCVTEPGLRPMLTSAPSCLQLRPGSLGFVAALVAGTEEVALACRGGTFGSAARDTAEGRSPVSGPRSARWERNHA